jgi:hypothetical protein
LTTWLLLRLGDMRRGDLWASLSVRQRQCTDQVLDTLIQMGHVRTREIRTPWSVGTIYSWVPLPVPDLDDVELSPVPTPTAGAPP